jgi:hypothetical protein
MWRTKALPRLLALVALVLPPRLRPVAAEPPAQEPTMREQIEAAAKDLPFFAYWEFIQDRSDARSIRLQAPGHRDRYLATLGGLLTTWRGRMQSRPYRAAGSPPLSHPEDEIFAVLSSGDARARTLALALLFDEEDPKWLPAIAARRDDSAETFPNPVYELGRIPEESLPLKTEKATVGDIAGAMVHFWTTRSGKPGCPPTFEDWWKERKDRTWAMAWFSARLDRAAQGSSQLPVERVHRARQLAARIGRLESPARDVSLLCLFGDRDDAWPAATELDLLRAARRLGPARCLAVLSGKALTDDPDEARYQPGARLFLLDHAPDALRAADRDAVLALARTAEERRGHWYAAVAHLDPARAGEAVDEGLASLAGRYDGSERAHLLWEAWTILGRARGSFVLDWLFRERDPGFGDYPYSAMTFLRRALDRWTADDRALVAAYVLDARVDAIPGQALQDFVEALERNLPDPAVPKGVRDRVHVYPANEKDPAVAAALAEWRKALRESVPRWAPRN